MKANSFALVTPLVVGLASQVNADESFDVGKTIFSRKCKACHTSEEGAHRVGPSLFQIFQRPAGAVEDFKFSKSFAALDFSWDQENLASFLANPKSFVPGTKMSFGGALLHKASDGRGSPFPGRTYPTASVTGMPSAV